VGVERPPGALVRPSRLKSICLNQATRFTIQDLGELDFMDAIYIDDVFEMYDMIFSLFYRPKCCAAERHCPELR
jgi:hypothetical protein